MTIEETYSQLGGNYEAVLSVLGADQRIQKYLSKFLSNPVYQRLMEHLSSGNRQEALTAATDLLEISKTLAFTALTDSTNVLCDALQKAELKLDLTPFIEKLSQDYQSVITVISQYNSAQRTKG